jgi:hypothetical protein
VSKSPFRTDRFFFSRGVKSVCQNPGISAPKARNVIAQGNALGWVVR